MKIKKIVWVSLSVILVVQISCKTLQEKEHQGGCNDYKIIRNEKIGTSSDSTKAILYGITLDTQNSVVPFANVLIYDENGKMVAGTTSGDYGEYRISLHAGAYRVRLNRAGYCDLVIQKIEMVKGELRELTVGLAIKTSH